MLFATCVLTSSSAQIFRKKLAFVEPPEHDQGSRTGVIERPLRLPKGGTGTAFADDQAPDPTEITETAPPAEPEEGDLDEKGASEDAPTPTEAAPKDPQVPPAAACEDGYFWESTKKYKEYQKGVGATQATYNGTSRTARSTFTSEVSGTVTVGVSGKLKAKASVAVAEIETEYSYNLSVSLTAKIGNSIAVDTPSKRTTNARYGCTGSRALATVSITTPIAPRA